MEKYVNKNGFTLTEVMIALMIMGVGFLAMSQMQFLSLRQKQLAEDATVATNMIQYVSDRDIAEVKRLHLLNSEAYLATQDGRPTNCGHCNSSGTACLVADCPSNPLEAVTPNPNDGVTETTCAALDPHNPDLTNLIVRSSMFDCQTDAAAINFPLILVKQATTNQGVINGIQTFTVTVTYAVKTPAQFEELDGNQQPTWDSVDIRNSLATQSFEITAHIDNWSDVIAAWNQVTIPNVP